MSSSPSGPPYAPKIPQSGLTPTVSVDVPICAVLVAMFVCGAVANMTILQVNLRRGHKFIPSGALFGFCMARTTACSLRIAWAVHPDNVRLLIASSILVRAGVLLLFILNLLFLQRILRALHPSWAWRDSLRYAFRALYVSVALVLFMTIACVVYTYYTLDVGILAKLRNVLRTSGVYLLFVSFIPIPGILIALVLPRRTEIEPFGQGSLRTKIALVLFTTTLLTLGSAFRAADAFLPSAPGNPHWYNEKPAFYCFNFVIEIIVTYTYILVRFDRRFHIPNGSSGPGHYSGGIKPPTSSTDEVDETKT
ncbi:Protein of unknown function (DUF3112) [Geosmithia morbida]|uniref:Family c-likeg-protein-coupled receptor protein n=1 Tax=Geosmithia morbida TaxID=1094350 RepID=A0A9P4Z164_9HYPO|nr:Protein of unknown function (DUF3112) [Geosmithia morbida]KAF4126803.1 Protein of unknown function (DUF3112) [Geosmithia morbida]